LLTQGNHFTADRINKLPLRQVIGQPGTPYLWRQ
jgi:hypothetical protein